jgi:hypothetical protein
VILIYTGLSASWVTLNFVAIAMVLHATRQVTQRCKHNASSDRATVSTGGGPQERNTLGWVATVYETVCYNARLAFFEISGWATAHQSHPVASPLNARQDYK